MGWVKLHDRFLDWEWFDRPEMVKIFIYFLLRANYEDVEWHGIIVHRGQFVTTLPQIESDTGLSTKIIRKCIERLIETREIEQKTTNKNRVITICKYDYYQGCPDEKGQPKGSQRADKGQTKGRPYITEEQNNRQKENNKTKVLLQKKDDDDEISGEIDRAAKPPKHHYAPEVLLTENEHKLLVERYGADAAAWMIQKLDDYKAARGTTYKSDYRAILNWVVVEWQKQKARQEHGTDEYGRSREELEAERRRASFARHISAKLAGVAVTSADNG